METIVVGVDGSAGSDAALRWALAEAQLRGAKVRLVHAYASPHVPADEAGLGVAGGMGLPAVFTEYGDQIRATVEAGARTLTEQALRRAGADAIGKVEIEQAAIEGPAARTLIESARNADLLVVGSRGRGGFLGLVLGSVSQQCAQHPPCPVVILPPPEETERAGS